MKPKESFFKCLYEKGEQPDSLKRYGDFKILNKTVIFFFKKGQKYTIVGYVSGK